MYRIGVLENGLLLAGAGFFRQQILLGLIPIVAVSLQMARQGRSPSPEFTRRQKGAFCSTWWKRD